jgi:arylsulfatase A-like enzyme
MKNPHRQPRILLLSADQLRADALGCYGNTVVKTPNIDQLAVQGSMFTRHYTPTAPCGPSRTSLLTGLYPLTHRTVSNCTPFDRDIPNIASVLAADGIPSYLIGYTDTTIVPLSGETEGVMPGFSVYATFNLNKNGLRPWTKTLESLGYGPFTEVMDVYRSTRAFGEEPGDVLGRRAIYAADESDTAYVADRTIECIAEHRNEPWLIHAAFLRPHPPWVAPAPYDTRYYGSAIPAPIRATSVLKEGSLHPFLAYWLNHVSQTKTPEGDLYFELLADKRLAEVKAVYLGLVAELDHHVGRILAALAALEVRDQTLIIFTSDHGDLLGDHWLFGASGFFDAAYHIPLIIFNPSVSGNTESRHVFSDFTESVDVAPTLLEWAGVPPLDCTDGYSLLHSISGEPARWRRAATFWEFDFRDPLLGTAERTLGLPSEDCVLNVWRTSRYKYVHFNGLPPLLFDLVSDPSELNNLAQDPAYRDVLLESVQQLITHRIRHSDQRRSNAVINDEGLRVRSRWSYASNGSA